MNHSEFKILVNKFISGTASEQEKATLFEHYERFQTQRDWDDALMGDRETVKGRIYNNIQHTISKKESSYSFNMWRMAASIALIIGIGALGLRYLAQKAHLQNEAAVYRTLSAKNQVIKITLTDGTQVWVNNGSRLRYPEKFNQSTREVFLEGEAFFDVAHQSKPFIIRTGKMVTQVLGTSFNVRAFAADKINTVSVVSGKVGVTVPGSRQKQVVFLVRNQELAFDKQNNNVNTISDIDAGSAAAWIANKIRFRNTPFAQAMTELERTYGVQIGYSGKLGSCPVFADFNRTDKVFKVLNMLARSLGGKVVQKDTKNYYLTGHPCN